MLSINQGEDYGDRLPVRGFEADGVDSNRVMSCCICSSVSLKRLEVAAAETDPLVVKEKPGVAVFVTAAAAVA